MSCGVGLEGTPFLLSNYEAIRLNEREDSDDRIAAREGEGVGQELNPHQVSVTCPRCSCAVTIRIGRNGLSSNHRIVVPNACRHMVGADARLGRDDVGAGRRLQTGSVF